jgi:hypothetical protein
MVARFCGGETMIPKIIQIVEGEEVCAFGFASLRDYLLVCDVLENICREEDVFIIDDAMSLFDALVAEGKIDDYDIIEDMKAFIIPGEVDAEERGAETLDSSVCKG